MHDDDDDDKNTERLKLRRTCLCTDVCTHSMYYKTCFYSMDMDNTCGMSHEGTSYDDLVSSELKIWYCLQ